MDPVKVAGVAEWPTPKSKKEVQQFVGFVNFYHRFILDFPTSPDPSMTSLVTPPGNGKENNNKHLKNSQVTSALVLILPTNSNPFRIKADSSDFTTGAILPQYSKEDDK
jgi:hypothetical protein